MVNNLEEAAVACSRNYNSIGRVALSKSTISVALT